MRRSVAGFCPACGRGRLFLNAGGEVTCSSPVCPRAAAASEILADSEVHHVVEFTEDAFTVRHPLIERLDDALMECRLHAHLRGLAASPVTPGRYQVFLLEGTWTYHPATGQGPAAPDGPGITGPFAEGGDPEYRHTDADGDELVVTTALFGNTPGLYFRSSDSGAYVPLDQFPVLLDRLHQIAAAAERITRAEADDA